MLCCSGRWAGPYENQAAFAGEQMHSKHYKKPDQARLVCVGSLSSLSCSVWCGGLVRAAGWEACAGDRRRQQRLRHRRRSRQAVHFVSETLCCQCWRIVRFPCVPACVCSHSAILAEFRGVAPTGLLVPAADGVRPPSGRGHSAHYAHLPAGRPVDSAMLLRTACVLRLCIWPCYAPGMWRC